MIVVAGEALIDLIVHPDGRLAAVPGGGPFNTARTIARLGMPVAFLGRLSQDRFGRMLRDALASDGVNPGLVEGSAAPTTLAIAELDDTGAATYRFHTALTSAPELSGNGVRAAVAANPAALHVGTLGLVLEPMATAIVDGVARASKATIVMLDPNCRPLVIADRPAYLARLDSVLRRADVVKVSADDLAYLVPDVPAATAASSLLDHGPAAVLVTDGPKPVVCLTTTSTFEVTVPRVTVVDTVGAGDAFSGAFLASWIERGLRRDDLGDESALCEVLAFAIQVATITCGRPGADPPHRNELA